MFIKPVSLNSIFDEVMRGDFLSDLPLLSRAKDDAIAKLAFNYVDLAMECMGLTLVENTEIAYLTARAVENRAWVVMQERQDARCVEIQNEYRSYVGEYATYANAN